MDKKKVKELVDQIRKCLYNATGETDDDSTFINMSIHRLDKIDKELSKSDWISVEKELPEFGEYVYTRTTNIDGAAIYPVTKREKDGETILVRDYHKFVVSNMGCSVTHWKPIEKLEL